MKYFELPFDFRVQWYFFSIIDETAELVSNIIKDGIEEIKLFRCESTKRAITPIAEKITNFKNPVNISILHIIV